MNLRSTKIKEYDTKEMKRLIQNTNLKITIHDTRDHKYSLRDFYMVIWRNGGDPDTIDRVFKKRMTKRFAIRVCSWLDNLYVNRMEADEQKGWREYLKRTLIKEYEPV